MPRINLNANVPSHQRWPYLSNMLKELLDNAGVGAAHRNVSTPYFSPSQRWADIDSMLTALYGVTGAPSDRVPVATTNFSSWRRWAQLNRMLELLYEVFGQPPAPTLVLSGAVSQPEGNSGTTTYTFTVTRAVTVGEAAVPWTFFANNTSANDFQGGAYPAGGTVNLANGQASGNFTITVVGDTTVEPDESFSVSISAPLGYQLGVPSSAIGTILNDDVADFVVANDAEFAAAHTAALASQIIETSAAGAFGDLTVTKSGLTIRGADANAANINRITVTGAQSTKLLNLPIQWTGSGTGPLISVNGDCTGLDIDGVSIRAGFGGPPKANFDTTFRTGISDPYDVGPPGGDANANLMATAIPVAIGQGTGAAWSGSCKVRRSTIRDVQHGLRCIANGTGLEIDIYANDIRRVYGVHLSVTGGATFASCNFIRFRGNRLDRPFAQAQDNGNPHREFIGTFMSGTPNGSLIPGVLVAGNIFFVAPEDRANGTATIAILDGWGTSRLSPYISPIVMENFGLDRLSTGIILDGHVGGYVGKNTMLANTEANAVRANDNEAVQTTNVPPNGSLVIGPASVLFRSVSNISMFPAGYSSRALVKDNIVEALALDAFALSEGNSAPGVKGTSATPYNAQFGVPGAGWAAIMADLELAAAHLQGKASNGLAGKGALAEGQTAEQIRLIWAQDNLPMDRVPTFVLWTDKSQQTAGATVTSDWAPITKLPEQNLAVALGGGGEIEIADNVAGLNSTGWVSGAGIMTGLGHRVARRRGMAGGASTVTALTTTVGTGIAALWNISTASATNYSRVAFERATPDIFRTAATSFGANSGKVTFAFDVVTPVAAPSLPGNVSLFGNTAGTQFLVQFLTTGVCRVTMFNAAAGTIGRVETTGNICDGTLKRIRGSMDLTQTTRAAGGRLFVNGAPDMASGTTSWDTTGIAQVPWGTASQWHVGGNGAAGASSNFEGQLDMFWLFPGIIVDLPSAAERVKFNKDLIGADGSGVTGTAPPVFITGNAAAYNAAGGINLGSGGKFVKVGTAAVTDV